MVDKAIWAFLLQFSRLAGNAIVFLVVARYLSLVEIGAFAVAFAPIKWAQALHKSGISDSVVVAEDQHYNRKSTELFWLSQVVSLLIIVFVSFAAFVADYFTNSEQPVAMIMLIMCSVTLANGLGAVSDGILRRKLRFRALAIRTIMAQAVSSIVAIYLALSGFGVWSLAIFVIANALIDSVVCIFAAGWYPEERIKLSRIKQDLNEFYTISTNALLNATTFPALQFAIGLVLGLNASGAFQIAQRVYQILDSVSLAPARFLALPLLSSTVRNGDQQQIKSQLLRALRVVSFTSAPLFSGTIAVAPIALTLLIGEENGLSSALQLQILALLGLSATTWMVLSQAFVAKGYAELALARTTKFLLLTAILAIPALAISLTATTLALLIAYTLTLLHVLNNSLTTAFANIQSSEIVHAAIPPYLVSYAMGAFIYTTNQHLLTDSNAWLVLFLDVTMGMIVYLSLSFVFARRALEEFLTLTVYRNKNSP